MKLTCKFILLAALLQGSLAARMRRTAKSISDGSANKSIGSGASIGVSIGASNHSGVSVSTHAGAGAGKGVSVGGGLGAGSGQDSGQSGAKAAISAMVEQMIAGRSMKIKKIIKAVGPSITTEEALRQMEGKLPPEVSALVKMGKGEKTSEETLQRARRILNTMVYDAMVELDNVIFQCKEFQEQNRGTYEQVKADLSRLGSELASLGERRVSASGGIAKYDAERKQLEETIQSVTQNFRATRVKNRELLTRYKNDIAAFDFILNQTSCEDHGAHTHHLNGGMSLCEVGNDDLWLNFSNPRLQAQVERQLDHDARVELRKALGQVGGVAPPEKAGSSQSVAAAGNTSALLQAGQTPHAHPGPMHEDPVPVSAGLDLPPSRQWKKCVDTEQNCGYIYDLMSLAWGRFGDQYDRLRHDMRHNQAVFDAFTHNFNDQLVVVGDAKTRFMERLANAISSINAATEEMSEKDEQKRELIREYDQKCHDFRFRITDIMYDKICVVKKVRDALLLKSKTSPPDNITDCDVADWESKTGDCYGPDRQVVTCDDRCPDPDPNKCGGTEILKRDIVVMPNANGVACPPTEHSMRCAQKKCPTACVLSGWTGWSKCTKACEGGVQTRTRSVLTKPKNGGTMCDVMQEERPCNTGSCDRDCTLSDWSGWGPCSMACAGGTMIRQKGVMTPIRGDGKCPTESSPLRKEMQVCNPQACQGDEVCVAQQDLIIVLDASGSLTEHGFATLQKFAMAMTERYKNKMFGQDAVHIGVILFGNGHLVTQPDGSNVVSPAMEVARLSPKLDEVRDKIKNQRWHRGLTNLAQALALADSLLISYGRQDAQSVVMVISDGKNSFEFATAQKARKLKDRNVKIVMTAVANYQDSHFVALEDWVSSPWRANLLRVPGLSTLDQNMDIFVSQAVTRFCPDSVSLNGTQRMDLMRNYMLVHENGWPSEECASWSFIGIAESVDKCSRLAALMGNHAFSYGRGHAHNRCYTGHTNVDEAYWDKYFADRTSPPCPGKKGEWSFNPFYDTYVMQDPRLRLERSMNISAIS